MGRRWMGPTGRATCARRFNSGRRCRPWSPTGTPSSSSWGRTRRLTHALEDGLRALGVSGQALAPLRRDQPARETLLTALGALYCAGVPVAWPQVAPQRQAAAALPTYPFQRERCWVTAPRRPPAGGRHEPCQMPERTRCWACPRRWPPPPERSFGRARWGAPACRSWTITRWKGWWCCRGQRTSSYFWRPGRSAAAERTLTGVTFAQMLVLPENGKRELQTFLRPGPNATVEVWSRLAATNDTWTRHAYATVPPAASAAGR